MIDFGFSLLSLRSHEEISKQMIKGNTGKGPRRTSESGQSLKILGLSSESTERSNLAPGCGGETYYRAGFPELEKGLCLAATRRLWGSSGTQPHFLSKVGSPCQCTQRITQLHLQKESLVSCTLLLGKPKPTHMWENSAEVPSRDISPQISTSRDLPAYSFFNLLDSMPDLCANSSSRYILGTWTPGIWNLEDAQQVTVVPVSEGMHTKTGKTCYFFISFFFVADWK